MCALGNRDVDLVLVLGSPSLITSSDWELIKQFAASIVDGLDIESGAVR